MLLYLFVVLNWFHFHTLFVQLFFKKERNSAHDAVIISLILETEVKYLQ